MVSDSQHLASGWLEMQRERTLCERSSSFLLSHNAPAWPSLYSGRSTKTLAINKCCAGIGAHGAPNLFISMRHRSWKRNNFYSSIFTFSYVVFQWFYHLFFVASINSIVYLWLPYWCCKNVAFTYQVLSCCPLLFGVVATVQYTGTVAPLLFISTCFYLFLLVYFYLFLLVYFYLCLFLLVYFNTQALLVLCCL